MRVLIFDTETTGKWNFRAGPGHPVQPDMVQLAMMLADDQTGEEISLVNTIVKPLKPIEEEAANIHGISQEKADLYGIPRRLAISNFHWLTQQADLVIAHNIDFDRNVMMNAFVAEGLKMPEFRSFCTMKTATPICKIPHANPNRGRGTDFKWPKLIEAYQILVDEAGFEGAHDALVDVRACMAVYLKLRERGLVPEHA